MALSIRVHLQVLHTMQIAAARSNRYLKAEAIFAPTETETGTEIRAIRPAAGRSRTRSWLWLAKKKSPATSALAHQSVTMTELALGSCGTPPRKSPPSGPCR